jgi:hypothetical protein
MTRTTSKGLFSLLAILSLLVISSANSQAGILDDHPDALSPAWTGSVPFLFAPNFSGTIDYAVFTASEFNANFSGLGYVPGDAVVYTYQVFVTGQDDLSQEIVGIINAANSIGTFDIGDFDATSSNFTPNATWLFDDGVPTGSSTWGLAFSSPNLPTWGVSLTIDGGTPAFTSVPTPGPIAIPEPSCLLLVAASLSINCLSRRFRK